MKKTAFCFWIVFFAALLLFFSCSKSPESEPPGNDCPGADGIGSVTFYNFSGQNRNVYFNDASIPPNLPQQQTSFWLEAGTKRTIDTLRLIEYAFAAPGHVFVAGKFTPKDCEQTSIEIE